jgi:hypothetical protein
MAILYFDIETFSGKAEKKDFKPSMIKKIITIQYKDVQKDLVILKEWESSEKKILSDFYLELKKLQSQGKVQIIGHNILSFDIPNLIQRMSINKIDSIPNLLDVFHNMYLIDTLQCLLSHNNLRFKGLNAEELASKLGIRGPIHKSEEMDGFYTSGQYGKIEEHVRSDINFINDLCWVMRKEPEKLKKLM